MRGDIVLVRGAGGAPLRRIVWENRVDKVMILNPDFYKRALQQGDVRPVGFPPEDVFEFDLHLYERLRRSEARGRKGLDALWAQAKPYGERRSEVVRSH